MQHEVLFKTFKNYKQNLGTCVVMPLSWAEDSQVCHVQKLCVMYTCRDQTRIIDVRSRDSEKKIMIKLCLLISL